MSMFRIASAVASLAVALPGVAAENRFQLFGPPDPDARTGVYLGLENRAAGEQLPLETLRMVLAVGDGTLWRRVEVDRKFPADREFTVRMEAAASGARLYLDGQLIADNPGEFAPLDADVALLGETIRWFKAATPYRIRQSHYRLTVGGETVSGHLRPGIGGQLELFEFPLGEAVRWPQPAGTDFSFETTFQIVPISRAQFAGTVDRYGQARGGHWPGRVVSDDDLKRSLEEEELRLREWTRPADWDAYGGLKSSPWKLEPTGFYRVIQRDATWWLISPEGHPLFYTGLCVAPALIWAQTPTRGRESIWEELPPKSGVTAELWSDSPWADGVPDYFSPHAWNLIRKYGPEWRQRAVESCARRLDAWAFSGLGKFCDDDVPGRPRVETPKLGSITPLVRHIDVFDPAACARVRDYLAGVFDSKKNNPRIVGVSVGNEFDEIFTTEEIREVLKSHPTSALAKAIRAAMPISDPATDEQIEKARQFYAEAYYAFLHRTVKELMPNHLYFGFWITPGWWQNEADWDMIVRHCDVLGYDKYALKYGGNDGSVLRLIAKHDKPTIVGEFSFPAWYGGERGFCRYNTFVETDRDSGEGYADYVRAAVADPRCIGAMWFQYRDEPITGWGGPGVPTNLVIGESYAEGLVDITDRPKWDVVTRVRETNLRLTRDRLER